MILVDTSVWIEHLHRDVAELRAALEDGLVLIHPFVIGELACGRLRQRSEVLESISRLPMVGAAEHSEVMTFVERHRLAGSGIGWLDAHLLASALIADARLWTEDRALARAWVRVASTQ